MSTAPPRIAKGQHRLVTLIATYLGTGYSPIWPGTTGTLATIPLAYGLLKCGHAWLYLATVVLFLVGIWAAGEYCALTGEPDSRKVVIDEVVGYLLCLWAVPYTPMNLLVAFLLFRLFDTWKPWPIRLVDRHVKGGFGVMADDVCAGAVSAGLLWFLQPYLKALHP